MQTPYYFLSLKIVVMLYIVLLKSPFLLCTLTPHPLPTVRARPAPVGAPFTRD